jgi:hypothetical protein
VNPPGRDLPLAPGVHDLYLVVALGQGLGRSPGERVLDVLTYQTSVSNP